MSEELASRLSATAQAKVVERPPPLRRRIDPPRLAVLEGAPREDVVGSSTQPWARPLQRYCKRALDIAVSAALLFLLLPLIAVLALLIRIDSPGPVFFRTDRVGYGGRRMRMLKFRKMQHAATGRPLTLHDDARFTRIGAVLANLKIDEIPQLWHVLRGDMSLVGPRPESNHFTSLYPDEYSVILGARPGMIGLSQVAFADEGRILDHDDPVNHYVQRILPQKVGLDLLYVAHKSVWLDLRILFWTTIAVLLRRDVAVHRSSGRMNLRRRGREPRAS